MAISVRTAGARQAVSKAYVMAGTLRPVRAIKVMTDGQLRAVAIFASPFSASASPTFVTGRAAGNKPVLVTTNPATAVVSGGAGPYTYSWAVLSDEGAGVSITAPSMASTSFQKSIFQEAVVGTARCTIADTYGSTATCDVGFQFIPSESVS